MKVGAPIIGLNDSGGARIQEGVVSLGGYADIFLRNTLASGVVPQLSVVLGPCAGGAVYSPAITDFTVMVEGTSYMFVTGPERRPRRDARGCRLGAARWRDDAHDDQRRRAPSRARRGRGADVMRGGSSTTCPRTTCGDAPRRETRDPADRRDPALDTIVPDDPTKPYDMHDVISRVVDDARVPRDPAGVGTEHHRRVCATRRRAASGSSPSSRRSSPARSTSTLRPRPRDSSAPATASTSRWSRSSTSPDSCRASGRSTAESSATARSCSSRTARRPCRS